MCLIGLWTRSPNMEIENFLEVFLNSFIRFF